MGRSVGLAQSSLHRIKMVLSTMDTTWTRLPLGTSHHVNGISQKSSAQSPRIFTTTSYIGYAGVFEGMKTGAFSVSINTRFDTSFYRALISWILGIDRSGVFASFLVRD